MPLHYRIVYDASQPSVDWWHLALESLGAVVVLVVLLLARRRALLTKTQVRLGALLLGAALALWWGGAAWRESRRAAASNALHGRAQVVEGPIVNLVPGKFHVRPESFKVGSTAFRYWAYGSGWGFHRTMELGGPLREGLNVRIHYVDSDILRLEVADSGHGDERDRGGPRQPGQDAHRHGAGE